MALLSSGAAEDEDATAATASLPKNARVALLVSARNLDTYAEAISGLRQVLEHPIDDDLVFYMDGPRDDAESFLGEVARRPPDLIIAIGPWALERLANASLSAPVLYAMVFNPMSVLEGHPVTVGGVSLNVPVDRTIELFQQIGLEGRRVGVFSDPETTGYLIPEAVALSEAAGIELVVREVRSAKDTLAGLDDFRKLDLGALWVLPSPHVVREVIVRHLLKFSLANGVPIIGSSVKHAENGALVALQWRSNEDVGRQAAEMANAVLRHKTSLSHEAARSVNIVVNAKTARKVHVQLSPALLRSAAEVIE